MPVPERLDWPAAGGVPEVFTTAHDALFTQARPARPASGCSSTAAPAGVGTAAIQLGVAAGARVDRDRAQRGAARRGRGARRDACIAPEGFDEHGPFDVILELVGAHEPRRQPAGARDRRAGSR